MADPCFKNGYAQVVHRYADLVLLLLIAALAWWLVDLDRRTNRNADRIHEAIATASGAKERGDAILKRLDQIDGRLVTIDNRLYTLSGRGSGGHTDFP